MQESRIKKKLPSYKNPPVVEVSIGVYYETLDSFLGPHLGNLWDAFGRKDYPDCQEHMPFAKRMDENKIVFLAKPDLPRTWFVSRDESSVIQFQRDRFFFNWRKKEKDYPRFAAVMAGFEKSYKELQHCLDGIGISNPMVELLELTYVNFIPVSDFGGIDKVDAILAGINNNYCPTLGKPSHFSISWQFNVANNALLNVNAGMAQNVESGEDLLRIEMSVRGQAPNQVAAECKGWFEDSRAAIVHGFTELTTNGAHQLWKRYE